MSYTIYSIGDSAFLEQILIALRMLTQLEDFASIVKLGLLTGVLIVFLSSLMAGAKKIDFQHVFLGFILFWVCFVPRADVVIEDKYTGELRPVSEVPLGPAFAGSMVSTLAVKITEMFEVAYSPIVPKMSNTQFAESLNIVHSLRGKSSSDGVWMALNSVAGGGYVDLRKSWYNYLKECTFRKIELGEMSPSDLKTRPFNQAVRYDSELFGTKLQTTPTSWEGEPVTCKAGFDILMTKMAINSTASEKGLNAVMGLAESNTGIGPGAISKVNDAITSLMNASLSAQQFVTMAIVEPIINEAQAGKYTEAQDITNALMVNQAIAQRNTQWATEQTMFMTIVRPMIAFFEAFIYAIMPIMAFAMALGSKGMQLAAKYLATLIWIQLWLPLLSIINLYIYVAATRAIDAHSMVQGFNWDSFYALGTISQTAETWVATGGLLASMTPALALMLVYGSSVTATQLAGRMKSDKFVDESMSSPAALKNGPVLNTASEYTANSFGGLGRTGSEGSDFKLTFGSEISSRVASEEAREIAKSQGLQSALRGDIMSGTGDAYNISKLSSLGESASNLTGKSRQMFDSAMSDVRSAYGDEVANSSAVRGVVMAKLAGSLQGGVGAAIEKAYRQEVSQGSGSSTSTSDYQDNGRARTSASGNSSGTTVTDSQGYRTNTTPNATGDDGSGDAKRNPRQEYESRDTSNRRTNGTRSEESTSERNGSRSQTDRTSTEGERTSQGKGTSGRIGFGGDVTASLEAGGGTDSAISRLSRGSQEIGKSKNFSLGQQDTLTFNEGLSAQLVNSNQHSASSTWQNTQTLQAARSLDQVAKKADSYKKADEYAEKTGLSQAINASDAAYQLAKNPEAFNAARQDFSQRVQNNPELNNQFNDALPLAQHMFGKNDKAEAWAMLRALTGKSGYTDDQRSDNLRMAMHMVGSTMPTMTGVSANDLDAHKRNSGLDVETPINQLPSGFGPLSDARPPTSAPSSTPPMRRSMQEDYDDKKQQVIQANSRDDQAFTNKAESSRREFSRDAMGDGIDGYLDRNSAGQQFSAPVIAKILGAAENTRESGSALYNTWSEVTRAKSDATDMSYDGNMAALSNMTPEQADKYVEGLKQSFGNVPAFQALMKDAEGSGAGAGNYLRALLNDRPSGMDTGEFANHIQTLKAIAATEGSQVAEATEATFNAREREAKLAEGRGAGLSGAALQMYAESFITNSNQMSEFVSSAASQGADYFKDASLTDFMPMNMIQSAMESSVPTSGFTKQLNNYKLEMLEASGVNADSNGFLLDNNGNSVMENGQPVKAFEMKTGENGQQQVVLSDPKLEQFSNLAAEQIRAGSVLGSNSPGFFNDLNGINALAKDSRD